MMHIKVLWCLGELSHVSHIMSSEHRSENSEGTHIFHGSGISRGFPRGSLNEVGVGWGTLGTPRPIPPNSDTFAILWKSAPSLCFWVAKDQAIIENITGHLDKYVLFMNILSNTQRFHKVLIPPESFQMYSGSIWLLAKIFQLSWTSVS